MSYQPPSVGPAGLSIPSYADILAFFLASFQTIYGQNVYLGNDSADYQQNSILALAAADFCAALQLAYNQQSPATAVGAGLSTVVAINGLQRKAASFSTCAVTLTGAAGAVVANGVIQNAATGDLWNLPASVTIGGGGTVSVVAQAQEAGAVNALASQLTVIATPTAGWTSVTNGSNLPSVGTAAETDAQLRVRQALSTELPSVDLLDGTIAAIAAVPGVLRYIVLENFTNTTDGFGNPAHSISAVVQGGTALAVATAIYNNRGIGVLTNGSTGGTLVSVPITDPLSGITIDIDFATPALETIYVSMDVHIITGSSGVTGPLIQAAVAAYLNGLQLGSVISFGELVAAANSINPPIGTPPTYSVRAANFFFAVTATPTTNTDISLDFYQAPQGVAADVVITFV
jgi:uncharacterized phage protein gp47/JayE